MDSACLQHQVTDEERTAFERDGYLIVDNAIPQSLVDRLVPISDRVDRQERERMGRAPGARVNHYDFIGKDDAYLELLDYPTTFPKVWGLLNWHIQLYHTHMTYTPPEPEGHSLETHGLGLGWHQDSGTLNQDLESTPRPRVSLKIAYFLTDTTQTGRGNFYVLPGSHLQDDFPGSQGHGRGRDSRVRACGNSGVLRPSVVALGQSQFLAGAAPRAVLRLLVPLAAPPRRHDGGPLPRPLRSHPPAAVGGDPLRRPWLHLTHLRGRAVARVARGARGCRGRLRVSVEP